MIPLEANILLRDSFDFEVKYKDIFSLELSPSQEVTDAITGRIVAAKITAFLCLPNNGFEARNEKSPGIFPLMDFLTWSSSK